MQTTASLLLNATGVAQNVSTASTAQSVPYLTLIENRWSNTAVLNPGCVVRPKSAQEVSQAVKTLVANQCQFAIKSGGHMPIPGANSIDGGVSIDLGLLNSTVVAPDRSYVSLGAGGTWGHAYDNLESEKIGFPGGVCGTTGVGGVSLGGGESLFQPVVGWVVDNVLNYEIVLASGEIVNANQTSNEDLYQALKGGSSNFGIVTRVDIAAFELGDVWGGQIILPAVAPVVDMALQATTNFTEQNNEHLNAGLQMAFSNFHTGAKVIDFGFASTNGEVNPYILKNITSIQPQIHNTVTTRSLSNVIQEFHEVLPAGFRLVFFFFVFFFSSEVPARKLTSNSSIVKSVPHSPLSMISRPSGVCTTSSKTSTRPSRTSPTWTGSSSTTPNRGSSRSTRLLGAATCWDCRTAHPMTRSVSIRNIIQLLYRKSMNADQTHQWLSSSQDGKTPSMMPACTPRHRRGSLAPEP